MEELPKLDNILSQRDFRQDSNLLCSSDRICDYELEVESVNINVASNELELKNEAGFNEEDCLLEREAV